jgi:hypothetical protein
VQLFCNFCQHSFDSMFGPPHARCPQCRSDDVRGAFAPAAQPFDEPPYRASAFSASARLSAPPGSVPSHVLNTTPALATSVALTLFCQPLGIIGIYFADRARNLARQGQLAQAREKLSFAWIAVATGWFVVLAGALIAVIVIAAG